MEPIERTYMFSNARRVLGWLCLIIVVATMTLDGLTKLSYGLPADRKAILDALNLTSHQKMIGLYELIVGLLLLYPRTGSLSLVLATVYWGGDIVLHLATDAALTVPMALLGLTWVGSWLRTPDLLLASFRDPRRRNEQVHL